MTCEMSWQTPLPLVQACIALVFTFGRARTGTPCARATNRQTSRRRPRAAWRRRPPSRACGHDVVVHGGERGRRRAARRTASRTSRRGQRGSSRRRSCPARSGAGLDDRGAGDHQLRVRAVQVERGDRGAPVVAVGVGGGRRLDLDPRAQRRLPGAVLRGQPGLVVGRARPARCSGTGAVHDLQPPPVRPPRGRRRPASGTALCGVTRPPPAPTPAGPAR